MKVMKRVETYGVRGRNVRLKHRLILNGHAVTNDRECHTASGSVNIHQCGQLLAIDE